MSRWSELASTTLTELDRSFVVIDDMAPACGPDQMTDLRRLRRVLQTVQSRLSGVNSELAPSDVLSQAASHAQRVTSELSSQKAAIEQGAVPDLVPANTAADDLLKGLSAVPEPRHHGEDGPLSQMDKESRLIQSRLESVAVDVRAAVEREAREAVSRANAVSEQTTRLTQDLEQALATVRQQVSDIQARADGIIAGQESSFSSTLQDQRERLAALQDTSAARIDEWLTEQQTDLSTRVQDALTGVNEVRAEMDRVLAATQKLAGVIAVTGLVGGYKEHANREAKSSFGWRIVTVLAGLSAAAFLAWAAFHASGEGGTSWLSVVAKSGVSAALGGLAVYTGRLAGRHHARAAHYRSRELALASLGPYVERLPETKQHELFEELAPRFFTELPEDAKSVDWSSPAATGALDKAFSQTLERVLEKQ